MTSTRTTSVTICAHQHDLALIDRAASILGKTRSEFILDTCRQQAVDVLLDWTLFTLDDASYDAFVTQLESPAPSTGALRKLLESHTPWER